MHFFTSVLSIITQKQLGQSLTGAILFLSESIRLNYYMNMKTT